MTTISRATSEHVFKAIAEGPQKINRANEVHPWKGKAVEMTAEEKAMFLQRQAAAAAAESGAEAVWRERAAQAALSPDSDTYTKSGKLRTEEEKAAFVQQRLDQLDAAEAFYAKHREEIEKNNTTASPTGQSAAENPTGTPVAKYHRYEESREMYLPNISDLSLENAKKALGIVELKIENHEDVGRNVHGHYGNQAISDLNTYLAALKDHISKLEISVSPASSEAATRTASTGE